MKKTQAVRATETVHSDTSAAKLRKAIGDALACVVSIRRLFETCSWTEVDEEIIHGTAVLVDAIFRESLDVVTDSDEYQRLKSAAEEAREVMKLAGRELVEEVWNHTKPVPAPIALAVLGMTEEMLRIAARTENTRQAAGTALSACSGTIQEVGHGQ